MIDKERADKERVLSEHIHAAIMARRNGENISKAKAKIRVMREYLNKEYKRRRKSTCD